MTRRPRLLDRFDALPVLQPVGAMLAAALPRPARRIVNSLPAAVAVDVLVWALQLRRIARKARA